MRILVRLVAHRVARCVWRVVFVFVFKQKTAYEMRISDWSSDVCSSDLTYSAESRRSASGPTLISIMFSIKAHRQGGQSLVSPHDIVSSGLCIGCGGCVAGTNRSDTKMRWDRRSEEHTSELQSLMRISYAVFCLKKKKKKESNLYETKE